MGNFRHIAAVAARQHGLVRTRQTQLSDAGIARAVRAGHLHRKYRGVYAYGNPQLSREGEWLAAVFAAGAGAGLTGLGGATMWEISRFKATGIDVIVPRQRRPQDGFRVIRCPTLSRRDIVVRNAIPVATVERVLIDATDVLWPEQIANLMHEAAFRKRLSVAATRRAMAGTRKRRMSRLERAIEMHLAGSAGTRSDLEDRFMRLVREAELPEPVINTHIHGVEVDFRWGGSCVEIDGSGHARRSTSAQDRANEAILRGHGLTVVRFTGWDIDRDPLAVIRRVRAAQRSFPAA
jgi:very-short-patch-repair endonuclease